MESRRPTVYRDECGSHLGMLTHQVNREEPCGMCRHGELMRRLETERVFNRPVPLWASITREDAAANRRLLADTLGIPEDTGDGA